MAKKKTVKNINYGLPCLNCANMEVSNVNRSCKCIRNNDCFWEEEQGYYRKGNNSYVCKEWEERKH